MGMKSLIVLNILLISTSLNASGNEERARCRDRFSLTSEYIYRTRSCTMCFVYLFSAARKPLTGGPGYETLVPVTGNTPDINSPIRPDVNNETSIELICEVLTQHECDRWKTCCQAAERCCQKQQQSLPVAKDACPRTWDGFSCWDDTLPGVEVTTQCPSYIPHSVSSARAIKKCTANGTWFRQELANMEWTDYTSCYDRERFSRTPTELQAGAQFYGQNASGNEEPAKCRDKFSLASEYMYRARTCTMCFYFLFSNAKKPLTLGRTYETLLPVGNTTNIDSPIRPDVKNETSIELICEVLTQHECDQWTTCCEAANTCCQRQQQSLPVAKDACPRTWDGFSCWDDTPPGVTAATQCPSYMEHSITSKRAIKECTGNGTWFRNIHNNEWTDYRPCVDKETAIQPDHV